MELIAFDSNSRHLGLRHLLTRRIAPLVQLRLYLQTALRSRVADQVHHRSVPRLGPSSRRVPVTGQVISWRCFIKRWSIETTFEESRDQLGFETQRQWSDLAIERTTPCLLSLYSILALLASWPVPGGSFGGAQKRLACQEAGDLQRCLGVGEAASVGGRVSFNIGIRRRQSGNSSGSFTALDAIGLLFALTPIKICTKSS